MTKSVFGGAAALMLSATALASAPQYHAMMLPRLDTSNTSPSAMNDAGVVTGQLGSGLGFIWSPVTGTTLLQPMHSDVADRVDGFAINNAGDIVGQYQPAGGSGSLPFMRTADGTFGPLPETRRGEFTSVNGINDSGMAVGTVRFPRPNPHLVQDLEAVYWQDGELFRIDRPVGATSMQANAVNNNGVVVGTIKHPGPGPTPYRWSESGGLVELEPISMTQRTIATDINDNGLVVGYGLLDPITLKAAYWTPAGELNILDGLAPGENERVMLLQPSAVNNSGVIVGRQFSDVVATPPPGGGGGDPPGGGGDPPGGGPPGGRGNGSPPGGGDGPPGGDERPTESNALVWLDNQPFDLMDLTVNLADLPSDIHFRGGIDVNASGQILIEASIYQNGQLELVTIVLTSVPAPGGATLLGIAGFAMTRRRR